MVIRCVERRKINPNRQTKGSTAMKCEICRVIDKLGIPPSAHDLWFCPDKERQTATGCVDCKYDNTVNDGVLLPEAA